MEVKLLGNTSKEYIEEQAKIVATAGRLSRYDGDVEEVYNLNKTYEENINFIERVMKLGHKSIIDHDYLVFAIKNVSPIIEQILIEERLASFTIKSRREVNFQNAGFYTPNFYHDDGTIHEDNNLLKKYYIGHEKSLFETYGRLIKNGISKEDARFILPYSFNSNIIMGVDAHTLTNMIIKFTKGKYSKLSELKELGNKLYEIVEYRTPYLKKELEKYPHNNEDYLKKTLDELITNTNYNVKDSVELLSSPNNIDKEIFICAIMKVYGYEYSKANTIYETKIKDNNELKNNLIRLIRKDKDILKQVHFKFQIPISYASLTHLTRHRMQNLLIPDFTPIKNIDKYIIPDSIINKGYDIRYKEVYTENKLLYQAFKSWGVRDEDLVYFYLSGNKTNVVCDMDGAMLEHFANLRACNRAQWEIRNIAWKIIELIGEKSTYYRTILGPSCDVDRVCQEGKRSCGKIKTLQKENYNNIK